MNKKSAFVSVLCFGLLVFFLFSLFTHRIPLHSVQQNRIVISDFLYHLTVIDAYLRGEISSPYTLEGQQKGLSLFLGQKTQAAMPIALSPVGLLLWSPFALLSRISPELASSLWVTLSLSFLASASSRAFRQFYLPSKFSRFTFLASIIITSSSAAFSRNLLLGQTGIIACGGMILLWCFLAEKRREIPWQCTLICLLLALKPPYLLLGVGMIVLFRGRESIKALLCLGALLFTLSILFFHGRVPFEYIDALLLYTTHPILPEYQDSIVFSTMNIARSAFESFFRQEQILFYSKIILLLFTGISFGLSLSLSAKENIVRPGKGDLLSKEQLFLWLLALVLLFSPYLGAYEDVLLFFAWLFCSVSKKTPRPSLLSLFLLFALLNQTTLSPEVSLPFLFGIKVFYFITLSWELRLNARTR